jgi:hypothetical protein
LLLLLPPALQDLGRDPAELLHRQLDNEGRLEERREQLQQAAPGNNLDDMAAAGEEHAMRASAQQLLLCYWQSFGYHIAAIVTMAGL